MTPAPERPTASVLPAIAITAIVIIGMVGMNAPIWATTGFAGLTWLNCLTLFEKNR